MEEFLLLTVVIYVIVLIFSCSLLNKIFVKVIMKKSCFKEYSRIPSLLYWLFVKIVEEKRKASTTFCLKLEL